jgi:predicted Fe-S protein YdhL (DUF1289 family)
MCEVPTSVQALNLDAGEKTVRPMEICSNDENHTVSLDSWAVWDPLSQRIIHDDLQHEAARCHQCTNDLRDDVSEIKNEEIIVVLLQDLRKDIEAIERAVEAPASEIMKCEYCGSQEVKLDAHSEYFDILDRYEVITTYDKGHLCKGCDRSIRTGWEVLSNHQRLTLNQKQRAKIEELRAEIDAVQAWWDKNRHAEPDTSTQKDPISIP